MPNVMVALPNIGEVAPSVQRRKVWLTPTTGVPCSNAAKTRNLLKLAGMSQTTGSISAAIVGRSSPYCGDIWRRYCCLTSFFPIVDMCLNCKDIAQKSRVMVPRWRFFASCIFSESRAARFRPASEIRTKATPCVEVWQTSNLRWLRLGDAKKKKEEEETTGQKYNGLPYSIGRP